MAAIARYYQKAKNGVHALQALIIFIGAAITIALYTKGGQGDGRINYYFVLCWLCIPALIYQTAFPIFERTKRFSSPYVHAAIDIVYMILWFTAFIAVLVWARQGSHAAKDWDKEASVCDHFAWGPTSKCKLGQATGALGAIIWLLFILTTVLSIYGIFYIRRNGSLPTEPRKHPEIIVEEVQEDSQFIPTERELPPPPPQQDQREEMQAMHHEEYDVSTLHTASERDEHLERPISPWERQPTPELPMQRASPVHWHPPTSSEMTQHQGEVIDWARQRTPDLPMGEGYYPVDTSYHGSGGMHYDPPHHRHQPSDSFGRRTPSLEFSSMHSEERRSHEGLRPEYQQIELNRFSWEHSERSVDGRIDFPEADYTR